MLVGGDLVVEIMVMDMEEGMEEEEEEDLEEGERVLEVEIRMEGDTEVVEWLI